jgi:hypothetical protein
MIDSQAVGNVFYKDHHLVTKACILYIYIYIYIYGFNYGKLNVI